MDISIYDFLKAVDESNRANSLALRYAAEILDDFRKLTPAGRSLMADTLMELISGEGKNYTRD